MSLRQSRKARIVRLALIAITVASLGLVAQLSSHAVTPAISNEAESGQTSSGASVIHDASASGGAAIAFGSGVSPARKLIVPGLADPGVIKVNDNLFFMSGTAPGNYLPIYKSADLMNWTELKRYDPNQLDPNHTYCELWAPSFINKNGKYYMYFSAEQVDKGQPCPGASVEPTTFYAIAPDTNMNFGAPQYVNQNTSFPRSYPAFGCPADGCDHVIRIDSNPYFDGSRYWLYYVWFNPGAGNTISAFPMDSPGSIIPVAQPSPGSDEQSVNEGPTVFSRSGITYLMYSQGSYTSHYAMRYVMSKGGVSTLTKSLPVQVHSQPIVAAGGHLLENEGHNSIVERGTQYYNIYHVGNFDSSGNYTGRDTYIQPIFFKPDGAIQSLNTINLSWPAVADATYNLDIYLKDGTHIGPCAVVGPATSYTYNDVCPAANNRVVHKADIAKLQVSYFTNNSLNKSLTISGYNGYDDTLTFQ